MPSIVDQPVNDVALGLFHTSIMRQFESLNPKASMDAILSSVMQPPFQSWYYPHTPQNVAGYFAGNDQRKILYLDGVRTNSHGANLMDGYASALGLQHLQGMNTWIANHMTNYLAMMSPPHSQATEYLDLVGYSAGGAAAECIMYRLGQLQDRRKKKCVTFGAPRPGGALVRDALARSAIARYMTPADPIPLLPPRLQDAPQLSSIVPVTLLIAWGMCVHPQGGTVVYEDGTTEAATEPPESSLNPGSSIAAWMLSLEGPGDNDHRIENYAANLLAATQRYETPREKLRGLAGGEDADDLERRQVNQQRDRVVQKIGLQQRNQNIVIANAPKAVLFKPVRQGRIWCVVFGDLIVCQGVREDTCRHICRAGNDFLKSLPKQGLVDPIALKDQFEQFLVYASALESDWEPKLKTNLDL